MARRYSQGITRHDFQAGQANLVMIGRLVGLSRRAAISRAAELLDAFGLDEAGGRTVKGYSGGHAPTPRSGCELGGQPRVLFLDEPTTGLDPGSRLACGR